MKHLLTTFLTLVAPGTTHAQEQATIHAGLLFDAESGKVLERQTIIVNGDRIIAIPNLQCIEELRRASWLAMRTASRGKG